MIPVPSNGTKYLRYSYPADTYRFENNTYQYRYIQWDLLCWIGCLYCSEARWDEVNRVATVAHLLTVVVAKCPELIKPHVWEFITLSLVSWTGEHLPAVYLSIAGSTFPPYPNGYCTFWFWASRIH
jgi:hypothetical protein